MDGLTFDTSAAFSRLPCAYLLCLKSNIHTTTDNWVRPSPPPPRFLRLCGWGPACLPADRVMDRSPVVLCCFYFWEPSVIFLYILSVFGVGIRYKKYLLERRGVTSCAHTRKQISFLFIYSTRVARALRAHVVQLGLQALRRQSI